MRRRWMQNERISARAAWLAAIVMLFAATGFLGSVRGADETMQKQLDALFSGVTRPGDPGLAVIARSHGKTIFEHGYGVRDLKSGTKIDGVTNFRLASVTKEFTAMCVMMLVREGKLRYEVTLSDVFPDFPAYGKTIAIRNVLNHTSGLMPYEEILEKQYPNTPMEQIPQIKDAGVLEMMKQQTGTKFPPGTKWEYSNSGYAVLAMVIEKSSGKPFGTFLHERIFAPLKMKNTIAYEKGKNEVVNRAYGHTKKGDSFDQTDQSPTSAVLGDGGIYSSVEDMAKWDDAIEHHILMSAKEMEPALTPALMRAGTADKPPTDERGNEIMYGFGWFLDPYNRHKRVYHDGSTIGFLTTNQLYTDNQLHIIILCNRLDIEPQALGQKAADIVFAAHK
jgi:CubicO group peptidase (beta-lactamase class C family)